MKDLIIGQIQADFFAQMPYSQIAVLVDENTEKFCYPLIKAMLPAHSLIRICSGEEHKNLDTCQYIWEQLTALQFDRKALLLNLGGGVIGDMGGFCAASFKRGIDFIQIPTTLLSQVDASVGGKLGIDFQGYKNHIGFFCLPKKVLIDTQFLQTLAPAELLSGFAEVIKHSLIADKNEWEKLKNAHFPHLDWQKVVSHSVAIKENIVRQDPQEKGLRKILNFGHTIGHAVETFFLSRQKILHGEAVALGMISEAWLSCSMGLLDEKAFFEIQKYIQSIYPKIPIEEQNLEQISLNALQDKKNESGKINASLLKGIGEAVFDVQISLPQIVAALHYYSAL